MKRNNGQIFTFIFTIFFCICAFAAMTFFTVRDEGKITVPTEKTHISAPAVADSAGFLINFPADSVFINFDFTSDSTSVLLFDSAADASDVQKYGYTVFKTVDADYDFLAEFTDRLSGCVITENGAQIRLTGVQTAERLKTTLDKQFKRDIISSLLNNIQKSGLNKSDIVFFIENTESTLNFPECYNISQSVSGCCGNVNFIN